MFSGSEYELLWTPSRKCTDGEVDTLSERGQLSLSDASSIVKDTFRAYKLCRASILSQERPR